MNAQSRGRSRGEGGVDVWADNVVMRPAVDLEERSDSSAGKTCRGVWEGEICIDRRMGMAELVALISLVC